MSAWVDMSQKHFAQASSAQVDLKSGGDAQQSEHVEPCQDNKSPIDYKRQLWLTATGAHSRRCR
jgi:hypothetical protein